MDKASLEGKFKQIQNAYQYLFLGSLELLELNALFWIEKALLRLVNVLARKRLTELKGVLTNTVEEDDSVRLRENMMEAQVVAVLDGHQLVSWETAGNADGYQAVCSAYGGSVFVSDKTVYSILTDTCTAQAMDPSDAA